jgi:hypothetical protein
VFFFFAETLWCKLLPPPPFSPLNITRYGSKTCSSCRTVLMLLSIEGPSDVFLFLGRLRKFAKPQSTNPRKPRVERMFQAGLIQMRPTSFVELLHRFSQKNRFIK